MIFETQPLVSWPFYLGILALLIVIGLTSLFFQWRKGTSSTRLGLRLVLLIGVIGCLSMAVLRPQRRVKPSGNQVLVYEDGLEKTLIDFWKDILGIKRAVSLSKFKTASGKVFLLGERFTPQELYPLRDVDFHWIQPERPGAIRGLSWKGYLRKGEVQRLGFEIFSESDSTPLTVTGANLEKQILKKGWNAGLLEFYPAGLGKAEFPLVLGKDTLTSVRFYIGASLSKKYHFQLGFPSAESRTLSTWLREKGETVTEEIKLSKETFLQSGTSSDSVQILLIDPAQLDQKSVQDALKSGKTAMLVMNVDQDASTAQKVNRLFGTDFQVEQTGQNENRVLENGIEALPFVFTEKNGQKLLQDRSVAIQYVGTNPIAMSLISASFPLVRQGKAEVYESVWGEFFGLLEPDEENAFRMDAPLLSGISKEIQLMSDSLPERLIWTRDSLALVKSAANPYLASGELRLIDSTWADLDSGFSAFVYDHKALPSLATGALIQEMKLDSAGKSKIESGSGNPISPWIWIVGMLLSLGLLWVEPRLDF